MTYDAVLIARAASFVTRAVGDATLSPMSRQEIRYEFETLAARMVDSPDWQREAAKLLEPAPRIEVGSLVFRRALGCIDVGRVRRIVRLADDSVWYDVCVAADPQGHTRSWPADKTWAL